MYAFIFFILNRGNISQKKIPSLRFAWNKYNLIYELQIYTITLNYDCFILKPYLFQG